MPLTDRTRTFVTGGARSGKSRFAEQLLAGEPDVRYVATGPRTGQGDPDWDARVDRHRHRRPGHWTTLELDDPLRLVEVLGAPGAPLLVDCLTLWLAAALDRPGAPAALVEALDGAPAAWVVVTSEVGSGVHPVSELGRRYRDALGLLNAEVAARSGQAWLLVAGLPVRLR